MVVSLSQTVFTKSCYRFDELPQDSGLEVCFLGRSNVGKSSLINALCSRKKLAKTSKTPGRTQCLNVYNVQDHARLVDCPGYGFAKVDKGMRQHWKSLIRRYMQRRHSLVCAYMIMDARHVLLQNDQDMLDLLSEMGKSVVVILNKLDCVRRDGRRRLHQQVIDFCAERALMVEVFGVSALDKTGLEELSGHISLSLSLVG